MIDSLPDSIFTLPVRVYYQDTDAGGVVYHSTYLDFMERARYEWLRDMGFDIHSLVQVHKVIFMVRSLNIEYFKPALLDDLLHITAQAAEIGCVTNLENSHERNGYSGYVSFFPHRECQLACAAGDGVIISDVIFVVVVYLSQAIRHPAGDEAKR